MKIYYKGYSYQYKAEFIDIHNWPPMLKRMLYLCWIKLMTYSKSWTRCILGLWDITWSC